MTAQLVRITDTYTYAPDGSQTFTMPLYAVDSWLRDRIPGVGHEIGLLVAALAAGDDVGDLPEFLGVRIELL
jgi:hypothetical protein